VNMVNVRSGPDLWHSYSTSPDEEPCTRTLSEFLLENEGKRCVVVLDVSIPAPFVVWCLTLLAQEIEKIDDEKALWSLHMPWEMGASTLGYSTFTAHTNYGTTHRAMPARSNPAGG
jgi:hypothetical protein